MHKVSLTFVTWTCSLHYVFVLQKTPEGIGRCSVDFFFSSFIWVFFAVICPRLVKCVVCCLCELFFIFLNTYWKLNRAMSADLSLSFCFCLLAFALLSFWCYFPQPSPPNFSLMQGYLLNHFSFVPLLSSDRISHLSVGVQCKYLLSL